MIDSEVIQKVRKAIITFQKKIYDETQETITQLLDWLNGEEEKRVKLEQTGGKATFPLEEKKETVIESAEVAPGTDSQK